MFRPPARLATLTLILTGTCALAAPQPWLVERDGWSFERSNIQWYNNIDPEKKRAEGKLDQLAGWAEYDFEIAEAGWYELALQGGVPGWGRDVDLDGERLLTQSTAGKEDMLVKDLYKETNLYLAAGSHRLRFRRLSFPGVLPAGWKLRRADGEPAGCVLARVDGQNVIRARETLKLRITGGTTLATAYDLVAIDGFTGTEHSLGQVKFPATRQAETRSVELKFPAEGVYELRAKVDGKLLRPADFRGGQVVVIDTEAKPAETSQVERELIHDIDCVAQTNHGQALTLEQGFWEAFGATRVVEASFGAYREGGDNLDPDIPMPPKSHHGKFRSGFSYAIDVPAAQVPYLLEVDYPDDDRRTVNVIILEGAEKSGGLQYPGAQLGSGYETGDAYALTRSMQTHRVLFWPSQTKLRCALVSMNPGMRAAAARIRVYRLGDIPTAPAGQPNGRVMASWTEEPGRWTAYFRTFQPELGDLERNLVGMQRWCQMARYAGFNTINPTEAIYQGMTYRSEELEGWFVRGYDCPRIMALLCEKYGLKYLPELHLSGQTWFNSEVVEKLVDDPAELYIYSRLGTNARGEGNWFSSTWNPLHPAIQDKYIAIFGELADLVADSPAFAGVSSRLMSWVWQGWNGLPSLNWGYGDWTIGQFEKDTGIDVPGDPNDPQRFTQRFEFLTADAMRETWVKWRCDRMQSYLERLRDRIRRDRPEAVLYLPYYQDEKQAMDLIFGSYFQTPRGALKEIGLDLDTLAKTPGIAVLPGATFGRRNSTPLVDAGLHDALRNPEHKALGFGYERGFCYGNAYFEDHTAIPIHKLGLPELEPGAYCGAAEAAGRNMLAKFSLVLADQDAGFLRSGGLGYTFGQPEFYHEWLREYENLPKTPFTPLPFARDPVAVWQTDGCFYAVNREPYALQIVLTLTGAETATQLGSGETLTAANGKLTIALKPYQLRAFRAAPGTRITDAETLVPTERIEGVRRQLAFCQQLADAITTGKRQGDVTDAQRRAFVTNLAAAWDAYAHRHYWRARTALAMAPMIAVYDRLATWPAGVLQRRSSLNLLTTEVRDKLLPPAVPMRMAEELSQDLAANTRTRLVDATVFDPEWTFTKVLVCDGGELALDLQVPVPGRYRLSIGHVADNDGAAIVTLAGNGLGQLLETTTVNRPDRTVFPVVSLPAGPARLHIQRQGSFGIYGLTLQPVHTPVPSPNWLTIGPFKGVDDDFRVKDAVKTGMDTVEPPETELDFAAEYAGYKEQKVRWTSTDKIEGHGVPHFTPEAGVSFLFRANVQQQRACYAVTQIESPKAREADLLIGCDWWAKAWLNGEPVVSERPANLVENDGAAFNGWTPITARVKLRKGTNTLLVKSQGGTVANWFTCYLSDPGDLVISAPTGK